MADLGSLTVEPLNPLHNREQFRCVAEPLERYLRTRANQDLKRRVAAVFVASEPEDSSVILGYYTLSATTIRPQELPPAEARRLPRYDSIPATLLGRLAVGRELQRKGLGSYLLLDALRRAVVSSREVASYAVVVDAKDEAAVSFYQHFEFDSLTDSPNRLYLPMKRVARLFLEAV